MEDPNCWKNLPPVQCAVECERIVLWSGLELCKLKEIKGGYFELFLISPNRRR